MYTDQTVKKTSSLPPDPSSLKYDILRKHHQAYTWRRCTEPLIQPLPYNECGWEKIGDTIRPICYTSAQLPPCLHKYDKSGYQADTDSLRNDAGAVTDTGTTKDKHSSVESPPSKRSRMSLTDRTKTMKSKNTDEADGYLADGEYALDNMDWQIDSNDSSEWEHLSEFSDFDSNDDDSD